jgi:hypothetical protein
MHNLITSPFRDKIILSALNTLPFGIGTLAETFNPPIFAEFFQNLSDHVHAYTGAFSLNIGDTKCAKSSFNPFQT